jgi:hypothetical protein
MKYAFLLLAAGWGALIWGAVVHKKAESEFRLLQEVIVIERGRSAILQDELAEMSRRPTYDQGYRDAIIRAGTPQAPGAYQDGYRAAFAALGDNSYAEGYHAALEQFGTKDQPNARLPKTVSMGGGR